MGNPEEIKDIPCSICGIYLPEDEMNETDHDWNVCSNCSLLNLKEKRDD
jgi:hypothetical protein